MSIKEMAPAEAHNWIQSDDSVQLIDVREPWEYEKMRIPGVKLIPLGEVASRLNEIDKGRPVLCICAGGVRSMKAAETMVANGFTDVTNLSGGTKGWAGEDLPLEP